MPSRTVEIVLQAMFQREGNEPEKVVTIAKQMEDGISLEMGKKSEIAFQSVVMNSRTLFADAANRLNNLQIQKETHLLVRVLQQIEPALTNLSLGHQGVIYCDIGRNRFLSLTVTPSFLG